MWYGAVSSYLILYPCDNLKPSNCEMGTYFSAFLSTITNKPDEQTTTPAKPLPKRKSKPELLIHRPTIPSTNSTSTAIHEFIWKYGGKEVLLAGTFTTWHPSIQMVPCDHENEYWRALVELDPSREWEFKFVVDGVWRCSLDLPTRTDTQGNTNNIIYPE